MEEVSRSHVVSVSGCVVLSMWSRGVVGVSEEVGWMCGNLRG